MQIVDPHIHLWDLETRFYPWLSNPRPFFSGDQGPITRRFHFEDLVAEFGGVEVIKLVHIDAGHDPADPVGETRWLQAIADSPASNGMPQAIVARADFSSPDVEAVLEAHAQSPNVRGIRHILNVHDNPLFDYVGRHFMREEMWRRNLRLLTRHGWSFDLQIYPTQMEEAAALAAANPDIPFILNHTGMFADRASVAGWRQWRDGLRALARQENVAIKISGLGMIDHRWTVESLRPYVLEAIDAFGTDRAMFASNFPVDRLYSTYEVLWVAFADIVADMSVAEQAALFRENAERIYRI